MSKRKYNENDEVASIIYYYLYEQDYLKSAKSFLHEVDQTPEKVKTSLHSIFKNVQQQDKMARIEKEIILEATEQQNSKLEKQRVMHGTKLQERRQSKSGSPFKRVDTKMWMQEVKTGLEDNSYEKTFGADGYGAKANKVLAMVKGKDFRHEKTKRKRSTYRGGLITLESRSFKYDNSD